MIAAAGFFQTGLDWGCVSGLSIPRTVVPACDCGGCQS